MLNKIKTPRFWAAVAGVIAFVLQGCGLKIPAPAVNEILSAAAGVLVLLGFIEPKSKDGSDGSDVSGKAGKPQEDEAENGSEAADTKDPADKDDGQI
jgi:uncharacterized membrane protein